MAYKNLLFVLGFVLSFSATAQTTVLHGRVLDSITQAPVAFANLTLEDGRTGTTTEIEGNFSLTIPAGYDGHVSVSHVSYQSRTLTLMQLKHQSVIRLFPGATQLMEVTITGTKAENPAFRIIREAVARKKFNDPVNLKSYSYISYNKFIVGAHGLVESIDSVLKKIKRQDSVKLRKARRKIVVLDSVSRAIDFFLSESVTEKQVVNPGNEKEKLLALQVAGYKSPLFTNVATDYQPFSFYNDNISLLGKDFINPVSRGTFNRYDFYLADTTYQNSDTIFIIQYRPKPGKTFNALRGMLSISTDGFAIKNVIATSADSTALTRIRIQQNYEKVDGHWFPTQLNTDLDFMNYKIGARYLIAQHRSFFRDIKINNDIKRSSFGDIKVELNLPSAADNKLILDQYRHHPLSPKDVKTFHVIDSMMRKLGWLDKGIEALVTQTLPMGLFELDLNRISKINQYESVRLGAGVYTSQKFSRWFRMGGYAGYGFRDKRWKYGGEMRFNFSTNKDFFLRLSYANDIYETGSSHLNREGQLPGTENFRLWVSSQYDRIEYYKGEIGYRILPDVHAAVFVSRNQIQPTYNYSLQLGNEQITRFLIAETGVTLRYVRGEKYMSLRGKKVFLDQQFPVLTFSYVQAAPLWDAQHFTYSRFDFTAKIQVKHRYGGKTNLFVASGLLDGLAPYGKLYNGRGASSTNQFVDNYFQTMGLYEFTATQYASAFLTHNFGNVILNKSYSKPELVLYQNAGIGALNNASAHTGVTLKPFDKGFVESGVGLNNIFRAKYVNVAYWGFGGAVFYRYGAYALPNASDNLFLRLTFSFGF